MLRSLVATALVALLAPLAAAQCVVFEDLSHSFTGQAGNQFGQSVVADGELAWVGAPSFTTHGAVFVMQRVALEWKQVAQILPPAFDSNGLFGKAVAKTGNWLFIGQPGKDGVGFNEGRVHVYQGAGASWAFHSTLAGSSVVANQAFGDALSADGDTLVVGAAVDGGGEAYIFEWNGSAWLETTLLAPSELVHLDRFGNSCSLEGNWLAIGAPGHDAAGPNVGAAYVFRRTNGVFQQQAKLEPSDSTANQNFGGAVALSGSSLAVSAAGFDSSTYLGGRVYVLTRQSGFWVEEAHLQGNGMQSSVFGASLAFDSNRLLIGAPSRNYARLFERSGTAWSLASHITPSLQGLERFGTSAALSGNTLFLGAPNGTGAVSTTGNLRTYRDQPVAGTYCTAKTNSAGCTPQISITGTLSASAPSPCSVQASDVLDNRFGMFVYGTSGPQAVPFLGGWLCFNLPLRRTNALNSGGTGPCGGSFNFDLAAWVASGNDPSLVAGGRVWGQFWSRDPGFVSPNNSNLTNAIYATICP